MHQFGSCSFVIASDREENKLLIACFWSYGALTFDFNWNRGCGFYLISQLIKPICAARPDEFTLEFIGGFHILG